MIDIQEELKKKRDELCDEYFSKDKHPLDRDTPVASWYDGFDAAYELMQDKTRCPCGGVILADTKDCTVPLCHSCYKEHCKLSEKEKSEHALVGIMYSEEKCKERVAELKKQCEAMATQIKFAIQNDNTSFMLPRFQEALKAYEKFKEKKDD